MKGSAMAALFEKTSIKSLELKNRLIRSATHEGMCDPDGFPTQALFKLYERLAKGGIGLIITGYAFVSQDGRSPFLGMQGMDTDAHVPKYRKLVDHVHQHGSKIAMQIVHCGRQTTRKAIGVQPVAPSSVKDKLYLLTPREMTEEDIERIIGDFAQAARRVRESGFDAVQIHASHGYLLSQFLCPHTNRRKDQWGGSVENMMRIVKEIYTRSREQVGEDYPILIKINAYDNMKNGLRLEQSAQMAEMMAEMGFDGIEVSCGIMEDGNSMARGDLPLDVFVKEWSIYKNKNSLYKFIMTRFGEKIIKPMPFTSAYNLESAKEIKGRLDIPVFVVGGITERRTMEDIINNGSADYISLCRSLMADPKFPEKIRGGNNEPSRCIHCNLCLAYLYSHPLRCYHGKRL
jgi:2,4-dienoyl-CoA reductase-like NADH-dependent reductase (Old Yellow Enzyme family)